MRKARTVGRFTWPKWDTDGWYPPMNSALVEIAPSLSSKEIEAFCRHNRIRKLSLFGSILTPQFRPDSDVDFLVEFEAGCTPGLFGLMRMKTELSAMVGRAVDLRTPGDLSRYYRDRVVAAAAVQYERS